MYVVIGTRDDTDIKKHKRVEQDIEEGLHRKT